VRRLITPGLACLGIAIAHPAAANEETSGAGLSIATTAEHYVARVHELMIQALALVGIRYRYGGDSPDSGFDCSGFVRYVFNQFGTLLPRSASEISRVGLAVARDDLKPGDLVFFNTLRRPYSHVGIYLGDQKFIHAPSRGGQIEIVSMSNRYWERRYNGARRVGL
jgi:cell wall-associated NlpC family hydrolase